MSKKPWSMANSILCRSGTCQNWCDRVLILPFWGKIILWASFTLLLVSERHSISFLVFSYDKYFFLEKKKKIRKFLENKFILIFLRSNVFVFISVFRSVRKYIKTTSDPLVCLHIPSQKIPNWIVWNLIYIIFTDELFQNIWK